MKKPSRRPSRSSKRLLRKRQKPNALLRKLQARLSQMIIKLVKWQKRRLPWSRHKKPLARLIQVLQLISILLRLTLLLKQKRKTRMKRIRTKKSRRDSSLMQEMVVRQTNTLGNRLWEKWQSTLPSPKAPRPSNSLLISRRLTWRWVWRGNLSWSTAICISKWRRATRSGALRRQARVNVCFRSLSLRKTNKTGGKPSLRAMKRLTHRRSSRRTLSFLTWMVTLAVSSRKWCSTRGKSRLVCPHPRSKQRGINWMHSWRRILRWTSQRPSSADQP